jgi:hypothetical protein
MEFTALCSQSVFSKSLGKKSSKKIENGHFKNVQNGKSQNTFSNNFLRPPLEYFKW